MPCSRPATDGVCRRSQSPEATTMKKQRQCVDSTHCCERQSQHANRTSDGSSSRIEQEEGAGRSSPMLVVVRLSRDAHGLPPRPACVDSTQRPAQANAFEGRRSRFSSTPHADGVVEAAICLDINAA